MKVKLNTIASLVLLNACAGIPKPEGTVKLDSQVYVTYRGTPNQDAQIKAIIEEARRYAHDNCGVVLPCFWYESLPDKFNCGDIEGVAGCYPIHGACVMSYIHNDDIVASSMPHETMHYIFAMCGWDGGGPIKHSEDFYTKLNDFKTQIAERLFLDGTR